LCDFLKKEDLKKLTKKILKEELITHIKDKFKNFSDLENLLK
jgi:hypothetical protein